MQKKERKHRALYLGLHPVIRSNRH